MAKERDVADVIKLRDCTIQSNHVLRYRPKKWTVVIVLEKSIICYAGIGLSWGIV